MEKLIVIAVIVVGSIIHSWIQRKQEEAAEGAAPPEPPPGQPPRPRSSGTSNQPPRPAGSGGGLNWEEEMRRLLQGEGQRPPSRSPVPPPVPKPVPAAPPPVLARSSIPVPDEGTEMEVGLPVRPVTFDQASSAHDRAQIQSMVAQRMQDTASQVAAHVGLKRQAVQSVRTAGVRRLLRDRESQRNVILASIVLGPPRAMENPQ